MAPSVSFLELIYVSPVADTLVSCLSVGELIQLARLNSHIRAILHGFDRGNTHLDRLGLVAMRSDLSIGRHHTSRWESLKRKAQWTCASAKHTKGSAPRHCWLCSMPICEACIVRDSFGKSEKTHINRTRYMCKSCWSTGNPHRACRMNAVGKDQWKNPYIFASNEGDFCTCSSKDRWLCLDCKEKQNSEAKSTGFRICYGEGCSNTLGEDKERRRICLWCDRPMTRGRATFESRAAFDQKCFEQAIRTRNQARNETWPEKLKRAAQGHRVSRRQLRDIKKLPHFDDEESRWANRPQFLPRLDVVDYKPHGVEPPQHHRVDGSMRGDFRYDEKFLVQFRSRCTQSRLEPLLFDVPELSSKTNIQMGKINWNNFQYEAVPPKIIEMNLPIQTFPTFDRRESTNREATDESSLIAVPTFFKRRLSDIQDREDLDGSEKVRTPLLQNPSKASKAKQSNKSPHSNLPSTTSAISDDYDLLHDIPSDFPSESGLRPSSRSSTPESFVSARSSMEDMITDRSTIDSTDARHANEAISRSN